MPDDYRTYDDLRSALDNVIESARDEGNLNPVDITQAITDAAEAEQQRFELRYADHRRN